MDQIQTNSQKRGNYILKNNLWKFFKTLRAQANPIYCLLEASPIHFAWITIIDKSDTTIQKRISISQFINSLNKMPSTVKFYRLSINTYDTELCCKQTFDSSFQHELSLEIITKLFPAIIANHCIEAYNQGAQFELTQQIKHQYKFKARYLDELQIIIEQCNNSIIKNLNIKK